MEFTHWFLPASDTIESDNVRMSELSHDGSFLEELDLILITNNLFVQRFHCHVYFLVSVYPHSMFDLAKIARSKMPSNSVCYKQQ